MYEDIYWHECITDNAKEDGEALGFSIDNIYFSLSYSQGDGASWVGTVDLIKWLEKHKPDDPLAHILSALIENKWVDARLNITANDSHYSHSNTMVRNNWSGYWQTDADAYLEVGMFAGASVSNMFDVLPEDYADTIADEVLQSARDYADEIHKQVRNEYERMCSEEYIAELCDANEYLFNKKGELL